MSRPVLVAEDDPLIGEFLEHGLSQNGYLVRTATDGLEALAIARARPFDLLILDRRLPQLDGLALLTTLRKGGCQTPALFLTALGDVMERVRGLDAGADDYMVKPVVLDEVLARVRALVRRAPLQLVPEVLTACGIRLDPVARRVQVDGADVNLTAQDFSLLALFMRHPRQVLTRDIILDHMRGGDDIAPTAVEHALSRLRRKLAPFAVDTIIETVRGVGYRMRQD